ncbi:metallophosphoesterase family protein [Aquibacillus kalidii]|uniref:metallophosphoesterase family protein n=1 Tax=Aquibacillus kalidii TaxID=2762597 RepID=UPI0016460CB0|nr:metallophosphoesterase family protein [Aquibacillus kalidii]
MRIAFISDIHGNAVALDAVLEDINNKKIDKIIVLGDIAYRGPEPKRSLDLIRSLHTTVIKGNADEWVVRGVQDGEVPKAALELMNKEREWTVSQLNEEDLTYLKNLPTYITLQEEGITIHAFHATPSSLFDVVTPDASDEEIEEKLMSKKDANLYLYGHIHKSYVRNIKGKTIINLGSIGLPFDGIRKASYAVVDISNSNFSTSIERVSYDVQKTIKKYEEVDYPNTAMMQGVITKASL